MLASAVSPGTLRRKSRRNARTNCLFGPPAWRNASIVAASTGGAAYTRRDNAQRKWCPGRNGTDEDERREDAETELDLGGTLSCSSSSHAVSRRAPLLSEKARFSAIAARAFFSRSSPASSFVSCACFTLSVDFTSSPKLDMFLSTPPWETAEAYLEGTNDARRIGWRSAAARRAATSWERIPSTSAGSSTAQRCESATPCPFCVSAAFSS
mmetsp:Transcript_22784/g.38497  ORF Transcript_22784/g.38497 Transcript_22784/m.38497 type:complete len:211 (+) Transcript_22784:652-1284(+)